MAIEINKHSETWQAVSEFAAARLKECRNRLEMVSVQEHESLVLRGEICAYKKLLALADPPPEPQLKPPVGY